MIFGYLDAVHRYHTKDQLRNYAFSTLAWKAMSSAMSNYRRCQLRRNKRMQEVSLYEETGAELPIRQYVCSFSYDPMADLKVRLLLHDLASTIPKSQMEMVRMRMDGCSIRQIAKHHHTTMKQVQTQLKNACTTLKQLCYDT